MVDNQESDIYEDPKYPDMNPDCDHDWGNSRYVIFTNYNRNIDSCSRCKFYKMVVVEHETRETTSISYHEESPMGWMFIAEHDPVEPFEYFGRYECPKCRSDDIANILFGYPRYTEKLQNELNSGHLVLGGCSINEDFQPDFYCNHCKYQWDARFPKKGQLKEND